MGAALSTTGLSELEEFLTEEDREEFEPAIRLRLEELPKLHPISHKRRPHPDYAVKERIIRALDEKRSINPDYGPELTNFNTLRDRLTDPND